MTEKKEKPNEKVITKNFSDFVDIPLPKDSKSNFQNKKVMIKFVAKNFYNIENEINEKCDSFLLRY
jgi:hypothetical protein